MKFFLVLVLLALSFLFISCATSDSGSQTGSNLTDSDTLGGDSYIPAEDVENSGDIDNTPAEENNQPDLNPPDSIPENEVDDLATDIDSAPDIDGVPTPDEEIIVGELAITNKVKIETTMGDLVIGLYGKEMPKTTANFMSYVGKSFYDGLVFHRVIKDAVIQGGGFEDKEKSLISRQTDAPIALETNPKIKHVKYIISMARTNDKNSATSQFFIMVGDKPELDGEYAAFGIVLEGQSVADAISLVPTESRKNGIFKDVPVTPIVMNKVTEIK